MRGDGPFAYDLVIEYGAVSGRVVLLLRSAEAKPRFFTSVLINKTPILGSPLGDLGRGIT
jgi:hypothetical protein